jgi:hypothetical protein
MLKGSRICKLVGLLTKMSINWDEYIYAITLKLAKKLEIKEKIKTRPVSRERLKEASRLLSNLEIVKENKIFVSNLGFLITMKAGDEQYIVLFSTDTSQKLLKDIEAITSQHEIKKCDHADAHFFFLIKSFNLPLTSKLDPKAMEDFLEIKNDSSIKNIDFDKAIECYGRIFAWDYKVDKFNFLIPLLLENESITCSSSDHDYEFSKCGDSFDNIVDLRKICRSIVQPAIRASDMKIASSSIRLRDSFQLCSALADIKFTKNDVYLSIGGGACFEFEDKACKYLAISLRSYHPFEIDQLSDVMTSLGAKEEEIEDKHFLSFFSYFGDYIDVALKYQSSVESVIDKLELETNWCTDLEKLCSVYEEFRIFNINEVIELTSLKTLCNLAVVFKSARSPFIPSALSDVASRLIKLDKIPYENIYLSLSASHWKHSFLEIYRVVEGLYYFGWMSQLKKSLESPLTEYELGKNCKDKASWTFNEKTSIKKLFEHVPSGVLSICEPNKITCLKSKLLNIKEDEIMRAFASAVYSIRNSNVHQSNINEEKKIEITADCWPKLTCCLFMIIEYFYVNYNSGMPPASGFDK